MSVCDWVAVENSIIIEIDSHLFLSEKTDPFWGYFVYFIVLYYITILYKIIHNFCIIIIIVL